MHTTLPDDPASGFEGPDAMSLGLTKREHFAALAMQGLLSNGNDSLRYNYNAEFTARVAVEQADALIEALNAPKV